MNIVRKALPRNRRRAGLILAALVLALALPGPALAGPADGWTSISATLYDLEPGMTPTLVISGLLPQDTRLPAEAALAVPKNATISWAGELTGDSANDPTLEFTVEPHDTYDLVRFTLTQSPAAQLELAAPQGVVTQSDNGFDLSLSWISGGTAERARIAIASPFAYHLESATPDPSVEVRDGDVLYWVEAVPVTAGQQLALSGSLVSGPAPELSSPAQTEQTATAPATVTAQPVSAAEEPSADSDGANTTWIIIAALLVVLAVVVFLLVRTLRDQSGSL